MKRREFITLLGGAAASPLAARAQQALPVVGFLGAQTPELFASRLQAFRQGLTELGHTEGRNVALEYRWAEGHDDRFPALAADLVRRQVAVIVTSSTPSTIAAKAATETIPIVFAVSSDPVRLKFVESLNRPGGNATGVSNLGNEIGPKRLELLHEMLPAAKVMAFLLHPANPIAERETNQYQAAARRRGLQLHVVRAGTEDEIESAFAAAGQLGAEALVIGPYNFFNTRNHQLATAALRHRMPAIFNDRAFAAAGGLVSYGGSILDQYRLIGIYAGRVLKGERPAELPVQQSTKIDLAINLKTAKALDLEVPPTLLVRADEVIE